tara:strand:+ start:24155 stop:25147 length:993 start_codon:yes stop_codon:yes gene_type:complete
MGLSKEKQAELLAALQATPVEPARAVSGTDKKRGSSSPPANVATKSPPEPELDEDPPLPSESVSNVKSALERANMIAGSVSDARKKADADATAARLRLESAGPDDTAIMRGRLEGAKARGAKSVREAEAAIKTPLSDAGKITIPKLPLPEDDPKSIIRSAARIAAKQNQVKNTSNAANANRESKIRELAEIRQKFQNMDPAKGPFPIVGSDKIRVEGLEQEIDELDLQIRNLDNLEIALESIRTKTLGSLPEDDKTFQEYLKQEKEKLEGEPTEFDPERSRQAEATLRNLTEQERFDKEYDEQAFRTSRGLPSPPARTSVIRLRPEVDGE